MVLWIPDRNLKPNRHADVSDGPQSFVRDTEGDGCSAVAVHDCTNLWPGRVDRGVDKALAIRCPATGIRLVSFEVHLHYVFGLDDFRRLGARDQEEIRPGRMTH